MRRKKYQRKIFFKNIQIKSIDATLQGLGADEWGTGKRKISPEEGFSLLPGKTELKKVGKKSGTLIC